MPDDVIGNSARSIDDIAAEFGKRFPIGSKWKSFETLREEVRAVSKSMDFTVSTCGLKLSCNRSGSPRKLTPDSEHDRKRQRMNILKCNCGFAIVAVYVIPTFEDPNNQFGPKLRNAGDRHTPELLEVKIHTSSSYVHNNGCLPSYAQSLMQHRSAGTLFEKESEAMDHLLQVMAVSDKNLDNNTLRVLLNLANPSQSHLTSMQLWNFRLWARKEIDRRHQPGYKKSLLKKTDIDSMFSNQGSLKPAANEAVVHAEELYRSMLKDTFASDSNGWKIEHYLEILKENDDCFDYRVARDGETQVPTAVVWQTGTQRSDFATYGCQLHLDFMMRRLNSYAWPYISVVVIDANGSPRCALEGIACSERVDAYNFAVNALFDMSPQRSRNDVLVVIADGKLEPTVLLPQNMNLPRASFFWDRYHLLNDILPKRFGGGWERVSPYMQQMIHAKSPEDHNEAVAEIHRTFRGVVNILNIVNEYSEYQQHYASYSLAKAEGALDKVSNNPAEQNHSSIVHWCGKGLYDSPAKEVKVLLDRQQVLIDKRNQEKSRYHFAIQTALATDASLINDPHLATAKKCLDRDSFERFAEEKKQSVNYSFTIQSNGDRVFIRKGYEHSPRVVPFGKRCNCDVRVQFLQQCRHETLEENGAFLLSLHDPRHIFHGMTKTGVKRTVVIPALSGRDQTVESVLDSIDESVDEIFDQIVQLQSPNENDHLPSTESPTHNSHHPSTDLTVATQRTTSKAIRFKVHRHS
jgi:hypothetical protein